jgi:hypothetical protein
VCYRADLIAATSIDHAIGKVRTSHHTYQSRLSRKQRGIASRLDKFGVIPVGKPSRVQATFPRGHAAGKRNRRLIVCVRFA